jgi:hypothetical protein
MGVTTTTNSANTYVPIQTLNIGGNSTGTFSSIPQTYTDLVLIINDPANTSTNEGVLITINSDSGSNYSRTGLRGNGSTANSFQQSNNTSMSIDSDGVEYNLAPSIIHFLNYSNTTTYKTMLSRSNQAGAGLDALVHLWRNTSAINNLSMALNTGTFGTGAMATLYGIKAA